MRMNLVKNSMLFGSVLLFVGCGSSGGGNNSGTSTSELPSNVQASIDTPVSVISQELTNTLSYMGNEERLAHDVYSRLYDEWKIIQFPNIINAEYEHITAVQQLVQKYKLSDTISFTNVDLPALAYMDTPVEQMQAGTYDIAKIQILYDDLVAQGSTSEVDALKVGCTVEVVDITDLDRDIAIAESESATDIVTTFNYLRNGSYSHYWAFDAGLKSRGVTAGCCTWSELCHPEYPQNGNGNGRK